MSDDHVPTVPETSEDPAVDNPQQETPLREMPGRKNFKSRKNREFADASADRQETEAVAKPEKRGDQVGSTKQESLPKQNKQAATSDVTESLSPFTVTVGRVYEGPLDLLLDLIRKQDIDIYDIPIARITAQFLAYVEGLKQTDIDAAGEFIYMASLLIHIKSRMLLPREPMEAEGESEDPRRELVERLLEHERFQRAAQMLLQKQQIEEATWTNPGAREFYNTEGTEPEIAADTVDLVRVFRDILERAKQRPILNVDEEGVTVGQMLDYVRRRLVMEDKPIALRSLLKSTRGQRALICMFLALLEMVRLQAILLRQDRTFGEVYIKKHPSFDTVLNESLTQMRDDWR